MHDNDQDRPPYRDNYRNGPEKSEVYSEKIRAGKRTYLLDVRATKDNSDYYLTITERKRNSYEDGFTKQKIFLYKEDFNKFLRSLESVIGHVKTELMPDYDYEKFDREAESPDYTDKPNRNQDYS